MSFARTYTSREREPDAELLAPGRRHPGMAPMRRDLIEDADFEVIQQAADLDVRDLLSSVAPVRADHQTLTRVRGKPTTPTTLNERLGPFSATPATGMAQLPRKAGYLAPVVFGLLLFACGVVYLAGGGMFTAPAGPDPVTTAAIPVRPAVAAPAPMSPPAAIPASPSRPSPSISVISKGVAGSIEMTGSKPRPARIERAGSIMMIRSGN